MSRAGCWLSLLLLACSDYGVNIIELPDPTPPDTDLPRDSEPMDSMPRDSDVPLSCDDGPWPAGESQVDENCVFEPETGSFTPVLEWWITAYEEYFDYYQGVATPVVGQVTDDDGDGDVDAADIPDIVLVTHLSDGGMYRGVLRVISGNGLTQHWAAELQEHEGSWYQPLGIGSAALADVDGDGRPEIATTLEAQEGYDSGDRMACYAGLYDNSGQLLWVNTEAVLYCGGNAPAFADLEGDGAVELILGHAIFDAADGRLLAEGAYGSGHYPDYVNSGYHSFAMDLDLDGVQEVVAGDALYEPSGQPRCITGFADGYPAAADLDGDGLGEFVVTGNGWVRIFEDDCFLAQQWELPDLGYGGPATIADYDGDGQPEIGVASFDIYYVFETDGTPLWFQWVQDHSSSATGSAVYDFDADGYAEVVYADETDLWIYAGLDGTVRMQEGSHTSGTVNELPIIVDVDGDGEVEIVVADRYGVFVIGDQDHTWVAGRQVWNQASYHIVNIEEDLTVPAVPEPSWPDHNSFRSGDVTMAFGAAAPDAVPIVADICTLECEQGVLQVAVQVGNAGPGEVPAGVGVSLYDGAYPSGAPLASGTTSQPARAGEASDTLVFRVDPRALDEGSLTIAVDDPASLLECDEDDNRVTLDEGLCP
jgi:hypothetical protein